MAARRGGTARDDRARIATGGESAGGGLQQRWLFVRDAGDYAVCHQHLTYPMLDNLTGSESAPVDPLLAIVWTRQSNEFGWSCYLGDHPAEAPYVPARGPCRRSAFYVDVHGFFDLFRDENIEYARRLLAAGVATELVVMFGACHAFQALPGTSLANGMWLTICSRWARHLAFRG